MFEWPKSAPRSWLKKFFEYVKGHFFQNFIKFTRSKSRRRGTYNTRKPMFSQLEIYIFFTSFRKLRKNVFLHKKHQYLQKPNNIWQKVFNIFCKIEKKSQSRIVPQKNQEVVLYVGKSFVPSKN